MSHNPAWIPLYWTLTKCYSKVSQVRTGSSITSVIKLKNMDLTVQFPKPPRNTGLDIHLYLPNLAKMFVAKIRQLWDTIKSSSLIERNPTCSAVCYLEAPCL